MHCLPAVTPDKTKLWMKGLNLLKHKDFGDFGRAEKEKKNVSDVTIWRFSVWRHNMADLSSVFNAYSLILPHHNSASSPPVKLKLFRVYPLVWKKLLSGFDLGEKKKVIGKTNRWPVCFLAQSLGAHASNSISCVPWLSCSVDGPSWSSRWRSGETGGFTVRPAVRNLFSREWRLGGNL